MAAGAPVNAWEEKVTIPTYLIGPPDPNPQFYFGGNSQGAQHRIYPYPVYDNLTTEKKDKTYTMVYLENEYIKIGILPELGARSSKRSTKPTVMTSSITNTSSSPR